MNGVLENDRQTTVSGFILSSGDPKKILLVHHRKFNTWLQPGGHVERDEAPYQAVIREVREETGLDVADQLKPGKQLDTHAHLQPVPRWVMEQEIAPHGGQPRHYHVDNQFVFTVLEQSVQRAHAESFGIGWFTLEEVQKLEMFPNTRFIVELLLAE